MNNTAVSEYMVYGFAAPESALIDHGYRVAIAQGTRPSAVPSDNVRTAMTHLLAHAGDVRARLVLAYYPSTPERDYAIALASNDGQDGLPDTPPPAAAVDRLRGILGIRRQAVPGWYYADRSVEDVPKRM